MSMSGGPAQSVRSGSYSMLASIAGARRTGAGIGAIGCSGRTGSQDEVVCKAGAATVK